MDFDKSIDTTRACAMYIFIDNKQSTLLFIVYFNLFDSISADL